MNLKYVLDWKEHLIRYEAQTLECKTLQARHCICTYKINIVNLKNKLIDSDQLHNEVEYSFCNEVAMSLCRILERSGLERD